MIVFVLTKDQAYTHEVVARVITKPKIKLLNYADMLNSQTLPRATYVFTDIDRLSQRNRHVAAKGFRRLRDQGVTVFTDPARVLSRSGLLRQLFLAGVNQFNAYRVEESVRPARWPVFLRAEGDHDGPITGLLETYADVQRSVVETVAAGHPLSNLVIVEYAGEPVRPGLFRKLAMYRVGNTNFADTCVHDRNWIAKIGSDGNAPPELYEDELRIVRENPHEAIVQRAFEIAGVEYGRADFGLVGGKVQIYEINSNPNVEMLSDTPSPFRSVSRRICNKNYANALSKIDTADIDETVEMMR
jgi:hypothetical protein